MTRASDECGKHVHATRQKASAHIRHHGDRGMEVYRCPWGNGFHVGHRPGSRARVLRFARPERFDWRAALIEEAA